MKNFIEKYKYLMNNSKLVEYFSVFLINFIAFCLTILIIEAMKKVTITVVRVDLGKPACVLTEADSIYVNNLIEDFDKVTYETIDGLKITDYSVRYYYVNKNEVCHKWNN